MRSLLRKLVDVREGEAQAMLLACAYFFFLMASYFILRPIRDTFAVAAGVSKLPFLWLGTLTAMLICNPIYSSLVVRFRVKRFIGITYQFFAVNLLLFYVAARIGGNDTWTGRAFYVWTSVFNLFVVSVFWSLMADTFRSEQAKRLFGFIGVGGTAGALAGSFTTGFFVKAVGTTNLLLVSLVLLEISAWIVMLFPTERVRAAADAAGDLTPATAGRARGRDDGERGAIGGGMWTGISAVAKSPYLIGIAGFLILYVLGSTVLYFEQTDIIGRYFTTRADRTQILGKMEFAAQSLTVIMQVFLTGRVIRWLGLAATLAIMPAISMVGFALVGSSALGVVPLLGAFIAFSVLRRASNFSLTNPSMEVLYTVVSREDKYKAKNFIETFVYRFGDQIAAWSYAGLAAIGFGLTAIAWLAVPISAVFLVLGVWLGRKQVQMARGGIPGAADAPGAAAVAY